MRKFRYLLVLGIVVLDQATKYIVQENMRVGESIAVWKNVFHLTYVQNRGAAFSLFMGKGIMLTLLPLIAILVAIWFMERKPNSHWTLSTSMSLIIAGGGGNLIDRIRLGYVTDMFDFHIWPVFNVADMAICLGSGFLVLYIFAFEEKK